MELFWNKKISISSKTSDPLGFLLRIKIKIFDILFNGLTNPVRRAKYYSLYPSFVKKLEETHQLKREELTKLEKSFLVANYNNSQKSEESDYSAGLLGSNALSSLTDEDITNFNFNMFNYEVVGFDRLKGNLVRLGLLKGIFDSNNELKTITTTLGGKFLEHSKLKTTPLKKSELLSLFKSETISDFNPEEKKLLKEVFLGKYKAIAKKDTYDVIPFDQDPDFDPSELLTVKNELEKINLQARIRYNSILYILSIFKKEPNDFLKELLEDSLSFKKDRFGNIRMLWKFYFASCGFQEVCDWTMYYFYELLKKHWSGIPKQDVSLTFEQIEKNMEYSDFNYSENTFMNVVYDLEKNYELAELPVKIKKLYGFVVELLESFPGCLIKILANIDSFSTNYDVKTFINFYKENQQLNPNAFFLKFFRRYCLPRQDDIITYRNYRGDEYVLIFSTESEILTTFYNKEEAFEPTSILNQFKLTNNALKILSDIGLILDNKLTEEGEKLLEGSK